MKRSPLPKVIKTNKQNPVRFYGFYSKTGPVNCSGILNSIFIFVQRLTREMFK